MDFRDFEDPILYADPDSREEFYAASGSRNLWDRDDLSVPALSDDEESAWVDEEGAPTKFSFPELASEETLRSVRRAECISAQHSTLRRKFERDEEFERSFSLNALFYPDELHSSPPAPPALGAHSFSRDELVTIAADSHSYMHLVDEADMWIRSVPLDALPVGDMEAWSQLAESLVASTQRLSATLLATSAAAEYPHTSHSMAASPPAAGPSSVATSAPPQPLRRPQRRRHN
jgi:hypothetical protein